VLHKIKRGIAMNILRELQSMRSKLDTLIVYMEQTSNGNNASATSHEIVFPLTVEASIFKGKKPVGILFGETEREDISTWKMAVKEIMKRCNSDPEKHVALMNLRGRVAGRNRLFLSKSSDNMRSPYMISENLYMETHYDTETLIRILTSRILDVIGYDYSHISIATRG
jgi:hypothetical protein